METFYLLSNLMGNEGLLRIKKEVALYVLGEDAGYKNFIFGRVLEHWVTFLFKKYLQIVPS